jgi:large subunit ribosomal protein L30
VKVTMMKIAVLRIRGIRKVKPNIRKTFELLRLEKPNHCVLVDDTPQNLGMVELVKDYVTYGPLKEETMVSLLVKRGRKGSALLREVMKEADLKKAAKEISGGRKVSEFANPVFRLSPPSKGFGDKKAAYPDGELGKREEMDTLLRKMI